MLGLTPRCPCVRAVLGEDLAASGGVVALAVARNGDRPLAVIVHRNSGAVVWDVRWVTKRT